VAAVNEINKGMDDRRATYIEYAQAVPLAYAIDPNTCVGCGCAKICAWPKQSPMRMRKRKAGFRVGSLILSPGTKGYDPSVLEFYGYGRFPNVVTSEGFERILAAGRPLLRPRDAPS
jgi:heterodisulfide reductase subunit A2